jgi:aspartate dehydrogenase
MASETKHQEMSELKVGLIGLGAIGRDVASQIRGRAVRAPTLLVLTRRQPPDAATVQWVQRTVDLISARPKIVIEAAGHAAVAEHVIPVLRAGIPVVLASVGALADDDLRERVMNAAAAGETKLILPGGAVGGIDYVRAVSRSADFRVRYCSRKPVAAWAKELATRGLPVNELDSEVVLFEGSAREAALLFPQNLNVAMTLALAGPGMDAIAVRVVADPNAKGNTHEIDIESAAGSARFVFENSPSAINPKTSALTALSIVQAVREHLDL